MNVHLHNSHRLWVVHRTYLHEVFFHIHIIVQLYISWMYGQTVGT
nr:unnamed protein product [Callosobruchus chinensis]